MKYLQSLRHVYNQHNMRGILVAIFLMSLLLPCTVGAVENNNDIPTHGEPSGIIKNSIDFTFMWQGIQMATEYQVRASRDKADVGEAPDTSNAWYSSRLEATSLHAASVEGITDGIWYWQARAIGANDNKSAWSETWQVTIDTVGPEIEIKNPHPGALFGGPQAMLVNVKAGITEEDLKDFALEIDGVRFTNVEVAQTSQGVELTMQQGVKALGDGLHILRVVANDKAGNQREASRLFEVDILAPALAMSVQNNQFISGNFSMNLNFSDAHPGVYSMAILSPDGDMIRFNEYNMQGNTYAYRWDTSEVANGVYTLVFKGRDAAGNEAKLTRTVRVNNFIPTAMGIEETLLSEMSTSLHQPLPTAIDNEEGTPSLGVKASEENAGSGGPVKTASPAVEATENGWEIFGILWYWWVLVMSLATLGGMRSWQTVKQYRLASS